MNVVPSILFTGFEPFGRWEINPTQKVVQSLSGRIYYGYQVIGHVLRLEYRAIADQLDTHIQHSQPSAIVLSGQATGDQIRLERVAVNEATAKIAYNCGSLPHEEKLVDYGSASYNSTLPLDKIYQTLQDHNIPVRYSSDAGKFGCNQAFYLTRHHYPSIPAGFIHVPCLPSQTEKDEWMEQEKITRAFELSLQVTAQWLSK